ncbi:MAG: membrane-associated PAP2 superfamily phosphatase [Cycloclasticus sp.]
MLIDSKFYYTHLFFPLLIFIYLAGLLEVTRADLILADWLFRLEGNNWILRDNFWFSDVFHSGGQTFFYLVVGLLIAALFASYRINSIRPYRRALLYLALAVPVSVALFTNGLKHFTHVDCPWDLVRYGGDKPFLDLFAQHPGNYSFGSCFPAGHSSIGYSLLSLYFFFLVVAPRWRFYGLACGIIMGIFFGVSQQLRGAHFISHDLWTAAACWFISLGWYLFLFRETFVRSSSIQEIRH